MSDSSILSFVLRAKNRVKVLEALFDKKSLISSQIEKQTGMYKSHVSRTLKELLSKKLIVCTNPSDRNYRFYKLASKGKKTLEKIKRMK
jgi:DNA-binding MarR family transcriptional regulator